MFQTIEDAEVTCTALMRRIQELEAEHRLYMQSADERDAKLRIDLSRMDDLIEVKNEYIAMLKKKIESLRKDVLSLREQLMKYEPDYPFDRSPETNTL